MQNQSYLRPNSVRLVMLPVHNNIEFQKPIIHHLVQFRLERALIVRPRERGYRILISFSGIADSMNCILDSKPRDSGFQKQKNSGFWNLDSLSIQK